VAFVAIVSSAPLVDVGVSLQELASDSIAAGVGVDEAALEDEGLKVAVDVSDYPLLVLVDFLELEVLGEVDNLGPLQAQRRVQVGVHLLVVHCHEQVLLVDVPQHCAGLA